MKHFEYLWKFTVLNAADNVYRELPDEVAEYYHVVRNTSSEDMARVRILYEEYRDRTKSRFFDAGIDGRNLMDVHKIAACLTGALVDYRLFEYDLRDEAPTELLLCNYAAAFLAGLNVLYISKLSDLINNSPEDYEKLFHRASFGFPETTPGHDPYVQGRIKTLAVNDINGVDFDVLTYADMLFWIEKYNMEHL